MEQLKDNLEIFSKDDAVANSMSNEELELVRRFRLNTRARSKSDAPPVTIACPVLQGLISPDLRPYNDFSMFEGSQDYKDRSTRAL